MRFPVGAGNDVEAKSRKDVQCKSGNDAKGSRAEARCLP